jgi:3-hydroxyacyl-CoA dehydrogenase
MISEANKSVDRGYLSREQADQVLQIHFTLRIEVAVEQADLVIEAVLENINGSIIT